MLLQYHYDIINASERLPFSFSFKMYSWLLAQLPREIGDVFHDGERNPLTQYLTYDSRKGVNHWIVSCAGEMSSAFEPILDQLSELDLGSMQVQVTCSKKKKYDSCQDFLEETLAVPYQARSFTLRFHSPTAFKSGGHYRCIPDERQIFQSVVRKWNAAFPEMTLDESSFELLSQDCWISDYELRTTQFMLKKNLIRGFVGKVVIHTDLDEGEKQLISVLLRFMPYCGVGIKSTLGMGGVTVTAK